MLVSVYLAYLVICVGLTLWAGRVLQENGRVFLLDHFKGSAEMADGLNRLLIMGFYLFSFGFIALALKYGARPQTLEEGIAFLCERGGFALIVLGCIHCASVTLRMMLRP